MGRRARHTLTLALATAALACGDALIIVGDNPGMMRVVVGIGDSAGVTIGESAVRSMLTRPLSLSFDDGSGELVIADQAASVFDGGVTRRAARMFAVDSRGSIATIFTGGGCSLGACVYEPVQVSHAPDGALLIADLIGNRVLRLSPGRNALSIVAGTGRVDESPDGTLAAEASFRGIGGVAAGPDGTVYFSERGMHRIRTIDADGTIRTIAGTGEGGRGGDGGAAVDARLSLPRGLLVHDGVLYVAESGNHVVRTIDLATGVIATLAGTPGVPAFGGDGASASAARLNDPIALDVSADGATLFIADRGNRRVRAVSLVTGTIATYAGTGVAGFNGSGHPAGDTHLRAPTAVQTSGLGFLFVADSAQHVVWRSSVRLQP